MDAMHLNLKYDKFCIMLQIDSRAFAEFVLARLDLVKIEKYLMQRSKVLFGRSVVIRVHRVNLETEKAKNRSMLNKRFVSHATGFFSHFTCN